MLCAEAAGFFIYWGLEIIKRLINYQTWKYDSFLILCARNLGTQLNSSN